MKLTQNRVRLLGGIATALGGIALLTGIWPHVGTLYPFHHQGNLDPSGVTVVRIVIVGAFLLCGGIGVLFEFDSDVSRKDPWEE
jgi:hypothetical protein